MELFSPASYRFDIFTSLISLVGIFILVLGVWVWLRDPREREHLSYFVLALLLGFVMLFTALPLAAASQDVANFWDLVGWALLCLVPAAILSFESAHLHMRKWRNWVPFLYLFGACLIAFLPANLFVDQRRVIAYSWGAQEQMTWAGYVFLVLFYGVLAFCIRTHWRRMQEKALTLRQRRTYQLTFVAMIFGLLASSDFLSYFGIPWPPFSFIFLAVWMAIMASAIIRYKLFRLTSLVAAPAIIEAMPGALFVVNLEGEIVLTNPYASKATLAAPEAMRDQPIADYLPGAPEILTQAKAKATLGPLANEQEGLMTDAEGRTHPVAISASPVTDENDRLQGVVFVAVGIEKLKEQMRTIGEQQAKLQTDFAELERVQKMLIGREMKMMELKKENRELKDKK